MPQQKIIAIMGPTASGKTAAALAIAREVPAEIISVDSALVYRDMNIGTAKPNSEELAAAPHHLIDIIDPSEAYSVAQFLNDSARLVKEIQLRGKLPILVGGTMMYYKALINGIDDLPPADPTIRTQLESEMAQVGVAGLHARLMQVDPITAARLQVNDSQRIQRALEIYQLTGQAMSTLISQQVRPSAPFQLHAISLEPSDRAFLHERIAKRFDDMLEQGFIDEVRRLKQRPDLTPDLPSIRCVGYRQAWDYLEGHIPFQEMRERGIIATRQLAKRQLTWCRSIPERIIIDCTKNTINEQVLVQSHELIKAI
ncbi:tRNA (adenosine(37)-N6)-dimethylallyltransferase MiaA [Undibacterium fentianense]|uniref:tRNA dimethylallyltransferase n=1 Tax=Undibacterium fentianense TaxID=2828728 RepID=A0A941E1N6_9BURK|nr:tRNA (adenosine(37)-N6)-dimethylallyltransferase MiaA [Undibacterium fentianense]MBR7799422.1 tRNA (adenosine(37)-N6)-dimethylallyltransferase MiaA [Undibacterium fentianense]